MDLIFYIFLEVLYINYHTGTANLICATSQPVCFRLCSLVQKIRFESNSKSNPASFKTFNELFVRYGTPKGLTERKTTPTIITLRQY